MILPIVAYGTPILKKEAEEIDEDFEGLEELILNMFDTMYEASVWLLHKLINRFVFLLLMLHRLLW